jgi:hypothetical protein
MFTSSLSFDGYNLLKFYSTEIARGEGACVGDGFGCRESRGKGRRLVYCLLHVCIIYCEEMVSIAEKKERTQEMRDRRENCVKSFLLGYENLLVVEINNRREKQR